MSKDLDTCRELEEVQRRRIHHHLCPKLWLKYGSEIKKITFLRLKKDSLFTLLIFFPDFF